MGRRLMVTTPYAFLEPKTKDTNSRRTGNYMRQMWGSMRSAPKPVVVTKG